MYWKYSGVVNNSPSLAGYEAGESVEIRLTLVNDGTAALSKAYCYVESQYLGMLEVKLASESVTEYREVSTLFIGTGSIGTIPVGETIIDFRFSNQTESSVHFFRIPIYLAHNDGATSDISFLWDYKDLLDYDYPGDESHAWLHPDGSNWTDDWRLWCPCYSNHHNWREHYGLTYLDCACYSVNPDSFTNADYWQTSGEPFA